MRLEDIILEGLMAFLPVYVPSKGDCTKLYTKQGGVYEVEKSISTILNRMCKYHLIDLEAIKKQYGDILSMKNLIPIPFTQEDIFVYIKVRKPLCKNDSASGFVNIRFIDRVLERDDKVLIELSNHNMIECLNSVKVINKHINNGHIVKKLYSKKQRGIAIKDYASYEEFNKPITMVDILFLAEKIIEVSEELGEKTKFPQC